jgi:hypothetical protein
VDGVAVTVAVVVSVIIEDMTALDWTSAAEMGVGESEAIIAAEVEITAVVVIVELAPVSVAEISAAETEEVTVATGNVAEDDTGVEGSEAVFVGIEADSIPAAVTALEGAIEEEVAMGINESVVPVECISGAEVDSTSAAVAVFVETTDAEVETPGKEVVVGKEVSVVVIELITGVDSISAAESELEAIDAEIEGEEETAEEPDIVVPAVVVSLAVAVEEFGASPTALASGTAC